jgi:hypothetical protein
MCLYDTTLHYYYENILYRLCYFFCAKMCILSWYFVKNKILRSICEKTWYIFCYGWVSELQQLSSVACFMYAVFFGEDAIGESPTVVFYLLICMTEKKQSSTVQPKKLPRCTIVVKEEKWSKVTKSSRSVYAFFCVQNFLFCLACVIQSSKASDSAFFESDSSIYMMMMVKCEIRDGCIALAFLATTARNHLHESISWIS